MRPFLPLVLFVSATLLGAVEVRKAAAEYPAHTSVADMNVGVEYMVTTFSAEGQTFTVDDHLILEVGIFPRAESKVDLRRFTLRINGKQDVFAQIPGMVAASVKYPDWTRKPTLEAAAGPVILGRPQIAWPLSGRSEDTGTEASADRERITEPTDRLRGAHYQIGFARRHKEQAARRIDLLPVRRQAEIDSDRRTPDR